MNRPTGTVTFLFTDIEGSTRRWEDDAAAMRIALAAHDEVLWSTIEGNGGWMFKHTGDGVCAAFASARAAVDAAIDAQRLLGLPVRMGIATGEAEQRGDDYFGPPLNRAARVMAVGHGGQVLLSVSTAGLVTGVDLLDLGEHRLRDLSGVEHLFQVCADGLATTFPPVKTVNATPGNLPRQTTSFVGRDLEVKELTGLVGDHDLVTLTGVGGVGKTRLAVQVAAELVPEFPDGVWLVELAPVGDPAAVPDAVATALGITVQAGMTVTASVAQALAGRRSLIVLDNCEHVIDAAADFVEAILARSSTVKVIATSREGLRVGAEHLWPVPSLDVRAGATSAAVELFTERASAVKPGFVLDTDADRAAVTEICARLDGIPLAIELAAARMVSMSPTDVRDRLGDRFRLLAGARRGLERHQTLRHAVQWSYELLDDDERAVLQHASVFADGFDLAAIALLCEHFDEYTMLDLVDSLVRKSLVTAPQSSGGRSRYGLLETIRQFAEDRLAESGTIGEVRDRHARYFAAQAIAYWEMWDGPGFRAAVDWVDAEFANLRTGFRWSIERNDLDTATAIAAHAAMLAFALSRLEPTGWAEETLEAARAADVRQLPRLYIAASRVYQSGRADDGIAYARAGAELELDTRYDSFAPGWSGFLEGMGNGMAGRVDRAVEVYTPLAAQDRPSALYARCGLVLALPAIEDHLKAVVVGEETLAIARRRANPYWIAMALIGFGTALADTDPPRAIATLHQCLHYTRENRTSYFEAHCARFLANLEAANGNPDVALALFDVAIRSFHQSGQLISVPLTLDDLMVYFGQAGRAEIAATLHAGRPLSAAPERGALLSRVIDRLRASLGDARFDECVGAGAAMELAEVVRYARAQIQLARSELAVKS